MEDRSFLSLARRPDVVSRAIKTSLVVGTLLTIINHADGLLARDFRPWRFFQIGLTYCVPYAVATYASVQALRGKR